MRTVSFIMIVSRIRKGEPIVLLIPNYRMYPLFCMWLNDYFKGEIK